MTTAVPTDDSAIVPVLTELFPGAVRNASSRTPFLLDDDAIWLVLGGYVEIFSVPAREGIAGRRAHLCQATAGQALFGAGAHGLGHERALLVVGGPGATLRRVGADVYRNAADGARRAEARALGEGWATALCATLASGEPPRRSAEWPIGTVVDTVAGTTARPGPGVTWARMLAGRATLLGQEAMRIDDDGCTPLTSQLWLAFESDGRAELRAEHALSGRELLEGLGRLHGLVLEALAHATAAALEADRARLGRKIASQQARLSDACLQLASALDPVYAAAARPVGPAGAPDALLTACRHIGAALRVDVKPAIQHEGIEAHDPLAAIARASRLRTRRVALRDDWWRGDAGPILAYTAPENRPVAIVPGHRGDGYLLLDPALPKPVPLTAESAQTLNPFGFTFYRPFDDRPLSAGDLVRFGLQGCRRDLGVVALAGLTAALLGLLPSIATGLLFNSIIPSAQRGQLVQITAVLIACALATTLFNITRGLALLRIESRMSNAVQTAVWDRLLSLPMTFFRPYTAGELASRAMGIDGIRQILAGSTVGALFGGVFSLVNFGLMFHYSAALAWRASLLILLAVAITTAGSYRQLRHQRRVSEIQGKTSGMVLQLLGSIAKLRVAGAEMQAFAVWARRFSEQRGLQIRARRVANLVAGFNAAFPILANVFIFWSAIGLFGMPGAVQLRTGDFLAFLASYGTCQAALLSTCMALLSSFNAVPLYEQAKPILTARSETSIARADPGDLTGDIEVQHVRFRYQADGAPVLRDISVRMRAGEFVAFVGPSGSGKSTLLRLLLGFEEPESGSVSFDGQELSTLDIQAVRRQVGVVLQSGRLMSGDIFTNIVGSAPLGVEAAWEAARMAGFAQDVEAMPMGMHTVISEGGSTLSGGQRQRLMIARALVNRPRLLFFDEATSALDNHTQAIVSASLQALRATRVVVAHRLSTIIRADRIYVIERGRVAQTGTYEELLAQPGPFLELAKRQIA